MKNNSGKHVLLLVTFGVLVLLPTLGYPFGEDQAIFAYVGRRLLNGAVLYRDVWDLKLGIYFLYAAIIRVFGDSMLPVRAFDALWTLLTSLVVYAVGLRFLRASAAFAGGLSYLILFADSSFWNMAQPDSFANLLLAGTVLCWLASTQRDSAGPLSFRWVRFWDFGAGMVFAEALLLRPTLIILAACLPVVHWATHQKSSAASLPTSILTSTAWNLLGLSIGLTPVFIYFASHHALRDLGETLFIVIPKYWAASSGSYVDDAARGIAIAVSETNPLVLVCACLGGVTLMARQAADRRVWVLFAYWLATVANVFIQGKFFPYHWLPVFAPVAIVAGSALELQDQISNVPRERRRRLACGYGTMALLLIVPFVANWTRHTIFLLSPDKNRDDWTRYYATFRQPGKRPSEITFSFPVEDAAARYLQQHSRSADTIVVWGFSPLVHFLSGRNAPSRFIDPRFVLWEGVPGEWPREYFEEVKRAAPKFIVVRRGDLVISQDDSNRDPLLPLTAMPRMLAYVRERYAVEEQFGYLTVLRRKS